MSGGWSALAVAIVGVVGTLGAALVTQSRADRMKRTELEAARAQRLEERQHAEQIRQAERSEQKSQARADLLRSCCVALNAASRQYMTAQVNLLHALRDGAGADLCLEQLEASRIAQRDSYAEAEMVLPGEVLAAATAAGHRLNAGYGLLKRISATAPYEQEGLASFAAGVDEAWSQLAVMQMLMRRAVGVQSRTEGESAG